MKVIAAERDRTWRLSGLLLCAVLVACDGAPDRRANRAKDDTGATDSARVAAENRADTRSPAPADGGGSEAGESDMLSCAAEIGAAAARRRAEVCRAVSPATRPPCDVANSCAMIDEEIARSCALFADRAPPMPGCQPPPDSKEAAAAVVRRYYSALDARDYDTAWRQWGTDGPPGKTRTQFEEGFRRTRSTRVTIGALAPSEGAAGSIYQTVPVTVDATLEDGTRQRFRGSYLLRRVNDIDGATPEQLRWHIDTARLRAVPRR